MIELFCQSDIDKFKESSPYPKGFADYLQARFLELKRCMEEFFEEEGEFNLKEFGHMVILEKSDDLRNLSEVGLNACDQGLFGDVPEEVCLIECPDFSLYEVQTALNNDFMLQLYLPVDEFEDLYPELKAYLKKWLHRKRVFKPVSKSNDK